jgi:hypothetical protein
LNGNESRRGCVERGGFARSVEKSFLGVTRVVGVEGRFARRMEGRVIIRGRGNERRQNNYCLSGVWWIAGET